ncbi:hypothetical protein SAMN05428945_2418 [Streptomyces sp. 2224.1]|uniref:hypothetical protein n=1 Tax=Streptomyces sp. 2224.1 TaxID=1881020 RepID=UPI000896DCEE|nr:hypothetical protein [Streptomyces sp. 2224.1]SEC25211.1 hypothetical protein SAMN05428945_2418 [Streptomyces sp. 2224.1]
MTVTTEPDTTEHETDQPETIGTETETPAQDADTIDQGDGVTAEPTDVVGALIAV